MGRKERRLREQQELRQSMLEAARAIAVAEGWSNVTMRKIADRVEYSHAAIYDYFESKDDLLQELIREGFHLLEAELRAARAQAHDPVEALRLVGRGYLAFAWHYPELYCLMYGLDGVAFSLSWHEQGGALIDNVVAEAIKDVLESCHWSINHLTERRFLLWSTAHGLVALTMANRIGGGQELAVQLLDQALTDMMLAWEHDTTSPFPASSKEAGQ
jgi:AcrR family transcriptional regulator